MAQSPLETWKEKLEYLLREESLATDAGVKFKLKKDIEECATKISELEVVFLDDIPLLGPDLKAQVEQKSWENYIREHLQDQLGFVSIPFFLKSDTGKRRVLVVLNVHFYADDPEIFRRAYDKEWLRIAESQAAPLLCEAYKSVIVQYGRLDNNQIPLIDSNLIHFPLANPFKP